MVREKKRCSAPNTMRVKTLDIAQSNYTVTQNEMLALVYAYNKFRSYFVGTKVIVYNVHAAIR